MAKPWATLWRQGVFLPRRVDRWTKKAARRTASPTILAELVAFESLGCLILVGLPAQFAEMRRRQTLGVPAA